MYHCGLCEFSSTSYNAVIEHDIQKHGAKVQDPGAEFSAPKSSKTKDIIEWVRKHPDCTLRGGEAKLLLDEIDKLQKEKDLADKEVDKLLKKYGAMFK